MNDTPLHEHPAVLHLMGTEHWPTDTDENGQRCRLSWEVVDDDGRRGWCFLRNENAILYEASERLAHSLITLAAVRGMAAKGWYTRTRWCGDSGHPACCEAVQLGGYRPLIRAFAAPTEPLAILAAYQAVCITKEEGK